MSDLPNKELLRPGEVADYLSIHRSTVYRLCETGKLQAVRIGERPIRVKRDSVLMIQRDLNE